MILVVGATAQFGRQTVERLVEVGEEVRALTRDPEKAGLPEQATVVRADLTSPETLISALDGVTAVFMVLPYGLDPADFLATAKAAGVKRIVFLSSGAVVDGVAEQPDAIAADHAGVEQAIAATGIPHTFLRLFFPAINSLPWAMQLKGGDVVRGPYATATSAPIHERDVADVAAAVLTAEEHAGRTYHLTGPESLTQADQLRILGQALGRDLAFEELDPIPVREAMGRFMDRGMLNALFDLMEASVGKPAPVNSTVEDITGHPARSYARWAEDHKPDFHQS